MRFKAILFALVLVLVLVASGCGSKKAVSTTGASGTTTTAPAASGSGGGKTTTGSLSGTPNFASTKNCLQLASIGQKFSQAMVAATSGTGKLDLAALANSYKALASAAPSAIRSDFETIAAAFSNYADALKKAGYTPGKVPNASQLTALAAASKSFSAPKLQAAEQHLSAWTTKNCSG